MSNSDSSDRASFIVLKSVELIMARWCLHLFTGSCLFSQEAKFLYWDTNSVSEHWTDVVPERFFSLKQFINLCVFRSLSAALSRFVVCPFWGRAWRQWASIAPPNPWWYAFEATQHVSECYAVRCTILMCVIRVNPSVCPGPRGQRVLAVGARGGGVWLSGHCCYPSVEKPDHAGHEPQLHQCHRQLGGETHTKPAAASVQSMMFKSSSQAALHPWDDCGCSVSLRSDRVSGHISCSISRPGLTFQSPVSLHGATTNSVRKWRHNLVPVITLGLSVLETDPEGGVSGSELQPAVLSGKPPGVWQTGHGSYPIIFKHNHYFLDDWISSIK